MMQDVLNDMASECPDSVIVTGGYSQGAAVNHRAIEELSQSVKDQIAGVVTYGDTQNEQVCRAYPKRFQTHLAKHERF
jgi:cutinase